jgi:hypothetical protein
MMQLELDTRSLKPIPADKLMTDTLAWIETNPEAWDALVGMAQRDALDFGRVRIKSYIESLRYRDLGYATRTVKLPNAFSAAFSRILGEWHPELRHAIPMASSKLDGCVVPPRSY